MKKDPSRKVLFRLAVTRGRQKAWRLKPEQMEQGRRKATLAAAAKSRKKHVGLVAWLSDLPSTMTSDQVLARIEGIYEGKPASFFNRLRRHGLMTWDCHADVWVNHCHVFPVV